MSALDELLARWRENPDSGATLALCAFLGSSRREDLIREVGSTAEAWHKDDAQVMLAVGRMYLDAGLLQEGQAALVVAGKLSPNDGSPYRHLGEVLLRRGDAARAEKVLARALQVGAKEADTRMWHDRAVVYVALQTRVGMRAVADEIDRTIPKKTSIPPPTFAGSSAFLPAEQRGAAPPRPNLPPPSVPSPPPKLVAALPPPVPVRPAARLPAVASAPLPSFGQELASARDELVSIRDELVSIRDEVSDAEIETGRFGRDSVPTISVPLASLPNAVRSEPPPAGGAAFGRPAPAAAPLPAPPAPVFRPPAPVRRSTTGRSGEFDDSPHPAAETVLDHLARVGVFDRGGGAAPAWVTPPRGRTRGTWVFVVAIVVSGGIGYGAFAYARHVRQVRMSAARHVEAEAEKLLETGKIEDLKKTDDALSKAFDLDSRSQKAAILWLRNRVLSALMLPTEPRGIESAFARCRTLEIDESKTAFGKIASFLAEGDLAGAAAILPKWDEQAKSDPFYQLTAGAMLERAGDVRAIGRYQQAFDLDPDLIVARVFHSELVTLELGIETGKPVLDEAVKRLGDGPISRALLGLAWAVATADADLPESARIVEEDRQKLPTQLLAIPFVVDARVAARADRPADALAALDKALRVTATPAMAAWIGQVSIDLADEKLARQAVLRALSYSALYPRARSLAARVALLGGHVDEAKKAIQELDAKSAEVLIVRAAAAYEALDPSELESATAAMGPPEGAAKALAKGMGIVMGKAYPAPAALERMATPAVPWGDLVAVDAALDTGNLLLAQKVAGRWGERAATPTYALRLARLLRYQGKADEAAKASADAVVAGGVTPRVLVERFDTLVASKDISGARDLLAQYPAVLGPMTDFLKVSADVADGKAVRAKALAARLEPPPADSPLLYEIIAARALVGVGDRRGKPLVQALLRAVPKHPDVLEMARAEGLVG
jgi:tetratricopeptide (TPR) repeat protein